tara:strand:- start:7301 stop:10759 length:3459 start_codon:yes stop_codon:yes gene_type:complete
MRRDAFAILATTLLALAPMAFVWSSGDPYPLSQEGDGSQVQARTTSSTDVPVWRVNDNWMYDGYLDVADFVADSGVSTNVQTLEGTLDRTVEDIYLAEISGNETLAYKVVSVGEYESDGIISIDGTNGCLFVEMETTEIVRVSDLATFSQEVTLDVYFWPAFFGCQSWLNQSIGVLSVENTYEPPLENYDFPISVGESWNMDYDQETQYSGTSNYVDIPEDSSDSNSSSWTVVSQGNSGVSFPGCYQSFNVTNYDSDGDETGYNWYCSAVRGEVKSSLSQAFGFIAVHELVSYQPVTRSKVVTVDIEYPLSPTGIDISAWINVTNQGQPVSGQDLEFRYESEQFDQTVTTDDNGSYHILFNSGDKPDDSQGAGELGSHGIVAWIDSENIVGASTLLIDSDVHEIDLVTRSSGVTVQRHRPSTGNDVTLDSEIGFAAVSGDVLTFSVPVLNRGLITSPASSIVVSAPDGSEVYGSVPPLSSLQESRVELNWTVPPSQSFGNVYLDFEVDPQGEIPQDGNRSNNQGSFVLFVGALPNAALSYPSETLTLDSVTIDGSSSSDPDGGDIVCEFEIEKVDGTTAESEEEDCILEWSWLDDGEFTVSLVITDGESDSSSAQASITVLNRPPEVTLGSDSEEVVVTNPITFRVTNSTDEDTQNPSAPVELFWGVECSEGRVSQACTVTPMVEGTYTIEVLATDDDGETTLAHHTVNVSNVAPSEPVVEVYLGEARLFPDSRGVFLVNEGEALTFWGQAQDSSNDLSSLVHVWKPDAEEDPDTNYTITGERSTISNVSYNTSGMHLATLQVFDDDGESTEMLIVPIQVQNLAPEISPITTSLGDLEEDEEFTIQPIVTDTENDVDDLTYCFDLDPSEDSDSDGVPSNDCDVESMVLVHSWPDSNSAPASVIFRVTDDDGASDSVEISFLVVNAPPAALASASESNPTEGDSIVLSANGTIDSHADMDSLVFHWDIDVTVDSDGDGDPANDVDFTGRWIEFSYDTGGPKKAKLTVLDDSSSHSVTMDIEVADAPPTVSGTIQSNLVYIVLALLVLSGATYALLLTTRKQGPPSPKGEERLDIDAAFDGPDESIDFTSEPERDESAPEFSLEEPPIIQGLDDVIEELTGTKPGNPPEVPPAPDLGEPKAHLDLDDIEALFEE